MSSALNPAAYLQYLQQYEKNMTRLYDEGRYAAFEESYSYIEKRIKELNGSSYTVVKNQFADWTREELSTLFPVFNRISNGAKNLIPEGWGGSHDIYDSEYQPPEGQPRGGIRGLQRVDNGAPAPVSSLNWATANNPLQMSVLPGPKNQGMCGACWAFVAAGSAEGAIGIANKQPISLSVQQLIDCATEFNRGCNGGNPMYAFQYIRDYGLVPSEEYPYADTQHETCHNTRHSTKAYINYDLEVPPNDEVGLKWYVGKGPVAVGVCGTDMDFMYYAGGIFNPVHCCQTQNHAVLLVGYGTDAESGTPYWILQNSWGTMWGEKGYMRVLRSTRRAAGPGVCGIATFPTMAVGGSVVQGNSTMHPDPRNRVGEWLLDHNEQIISLFAAACFLLSIALLILTYWFSCRRREHDRVARNRAVSRIKLDVVRSRNGSFDEAGSGGRLTPGSPSNPNGLSGSDMHYIQTQLLEASIGSGSGQHFHNHGGVEYFEYEEDPTELSGLMDGKRLFCKANVTPFTSAPNSRGASRAGSRAGSRVASRSGSPTSMLLLEKRYSQHYGSVDDADNNDEKSRF